MIVASLTIRGEGLHRLVDDLQRGGDECYASPTGRFFVFASEAFYMRTATDLLSYAIVEFLSEAECAVRIVSGGGGAWLLGGDRLAERSDRKKIVAYFEDLCQRYGWEFEREAQARAAAPVGPPRLTAEAIIEHLGLKPHPSEGGYYVETWRADEAIAREALPERYGAARALGTCIYFLLTPDAFSEMHRLPTDEIFHFYLGDPVTQLQLLPDGASRMVTLGSDLMAGQQPQVIVPRGVWQGAFLNAGGRFALLGTTMAPGFDFADYETGQRADLVGRWPERHKLIARLTPGPGDAGPANARPPRL